MQEVQDETGNTYYFNENTQETSWDRPTSSSSSSNPLSTSDTSSELASGWAEVYDDSGNLYYYNEASGKVVPFSKILKIEQGNLVGRNLLQTLQQY